MMLRSLLNSTSRCSFFKGEARLVSWKRKWGRNDGYLHLEIVLVCVFASELWDFLEDQVLNGGSVMTLDVRIQTDFKGSLP